MTLLDGRSAIATPTDLVVVATVGFESGALSVAEDYDVDFLCPAALSRLADSAVEAGSPEG